MKDTEFLQINMLGGFSLSYGGKTIDYQSSRSKKCWLLLEYLLTFRNKEISQNNLIEVLWGDEDTDNPANTLKTLLHRVRSMLDELEFANGKEMITYSRGTYAWNRTLNCVIDVDLFENACQQGDTAEEDSDKIIYYLEAIRIYKGDFLPKSSLEPWVVPIHTYYHSEYLRIVHHCVELLNAAGRKYEVIDVCQMAVSIDPYDETLHYFLIKALNETGSKQAALNHYEYVTELFYSEFNIDLSEEIIALYKEIMKTSNSMELDLNMVREKLNEKDDVPGAFYCEYPLFKDIYQLETRSAERNGQSVYLCMLTVSNQEGGNVKSKKIINQSMSLLHQSIQSSLRRGDVFTRYSVSQYLLMLPLTTFENGEMVLKRIQKSFKRSNPRLPVLIHYKLQPLTPSI